MNSVADWLMPGLAFPALRGLRDRERAPAPGLWPHPLQFRLRLSALWHATSINALCKKEKQNKTKTGKTKRCRDYGVTVTGDIPSLHFVITTVWPFTGLRNTDDRMRVALRDSDR